MSTINVQPSKDAAASVAYVLYGNDKAFRERLRSRGQTRAAALLLNMTATMDNVKKIYTDK